MTSYTVLIKTETLDPSLQDLSQVCNEQGVDVFISQDGVKQEPADHYDASDAHVVVNRSVGHVKSEADDSTEEYTPMSEDYGLKDCVKSEYTDNQNYVKMESIDSLEMSNIQKYTSSRTKSYHQYHDKVFKSALNVEHGDQNICDEDNLNTSNEETEMEDDSSSSTANKKDSELFKTEIYEQKGVDVNHTTNITHSCDADNIDGDTNYNNKEKMVHLEKEAKNKSNDESYENGSENCGKTTLLDIKNTTAFECSLCPRRFETKHELIRHAGRHTCWEKIHKGKQSYECDICSTSFKSDWQFGSHCRKQHPEHGAKYECSLCQKTYITYISFKMHMDVHKGVRHTCNSCDKSFVRKECLQNHVQLHHNNKDNTKYLSCDICNKLFATKVNLDLHMEIHTGIQKYICKVCGARFSRAVDFQIHEHSHTGEKPYKCPDCGKCFRSSGSVGRHRKIHDGNKDTCKICSKSFTSFESFKRHIASHAKANETVRDGSERNKTVYPCSLCKNVLSSELNLLNHMKRHERKEEMSTLAPEEYPCDQCEKVFSTRRNRGRHIRRNHHLKKTRYTCDLCSKDFSSKGTLKMHTLAAHFGKKPHPCPHCSIGYHRKDQLKRHIKREHSQKLEQKHS